jgi:hypothetical protein
MPPLCALRAEPFGIRYCVDLAASEPRVNRWLRLWGRLPVTDFGLHPHGVGLVSQLRLMGQNLLFYTIAGPSSAPSCSAR